MLTPTQVKRLKPGTLLKDEVGGATCFDNESIHQVAPGSTYMVLSKWKASTPDRINVLCVPLGRKVNWEICLEDEDDQFLTDMSIVEEPDA